MLRLSLVVEVPYFFFFFQKKNFGDKIRKKNRSAVMPSVSRVGGVPKGSPKGVVRPRGCLTEQKISCRCSRSEGSDQPGDLPTKTKLPVF